jgi:anti-anti-sigma regulatory factor
MEEMSLGAKDSLPTHIIIGCSMLSYIDTTGVTTLKTTVKKHEEIKIMSPDSMSGSCREYADKRRIL